MNENIPLVSIIIVNLNGKHFLEKCLQSLSKLSYKNTEFIIVDNDSSDDSIEFIKKNFSFIKIIKLDKNYGFAKPNNIGAKASKGDYLLFLNNDTIPNFDFVSHLVQVIEKDPKIAICQSLLLKLDDTVDSAGDFIDTLGRAFNSKIIPKKVEPIFSARGASMLVRRKIFFDLNGFDEVFFVSFEDVDLGWRARIEDYQVVIVPNSIVYHLGGETIKKLKQEIQFHGSKNSIILRLTNFELSFALKSSIILFFVIFLKRFFKINVIQNSEKSVSIPPISTVASALVWVIKNLKYVLKKRKSINSKRIISTKKLIEMGLIKKY